MTDILVMESAGKSFAQLSAYSGFHQANFRINGKPAVVAPGDSKWAMVDGKIERIEERSVSHTLAGWELLEAHRNDPAVTLPVSRPAADLKPHYDNDGDEVRPWFRDLYTATYIEIETWTPKAFTVIDANCEPRVIPSDVVIEVPSRLSQWCQTHHKYPCKMSREALFKRVRTALLAALAGNKDAVVTDYENLQALRIEIKVWIPESIRKPEKVLTNIFSKRPKEVFVTPEFRTVKLLNLEGTYNGGKDSTLPLWLTGANLDDLMAKVDIVIAEYVEQVRDNRFQYCEHCAGRGVVERST